MTKITLCAALIALLPQTGIAQDTPFDPSGTRNCLAETVDLLDQRDCGVFGRGVCGCVNRGFNTRSMTSCLMSEYAMFDKMLNLAYTNVRDLAQELDEFDSGASFDEVSMVDRLVQMQRAWITYRDATCAYERRQYDGGTLGQLIHADCMMTLTAEQTFRLQSSVLGI